MSLHFRTLGGLSLSGRSSIRRRPRLAPLFSSSSFSLPVCPEPVWGGAGTGTGMWETMSCHLFFACFYLQVVLSLSILSPGYTEGWFCVIISFSSLYSILFFWRVGDGTLRCYQHCLYPSGSLSQNICFSSLQLWALLVQSPWYQE